MKWIENETVKPESKIKADQVHLSLLLVLREIHYIHLVFAFDLCCVHFTFQTHVLL